MSEKYTSSSKSTRRTDNDAWEAWVIDHLDDDNDGGLDSAISLESVPLNNSNHDKGVDGIDGRRQQYHHSLMISELGPLVKLGTSSVAVGFGNVVKIITVGHEHFDRPRDRLTRDNLRNFSSTSRRKRERERASGGGGNTVPGRGGTSISDFGRDR